MNAESRHNTFPRATAKDRLHEIVSGLFDRFAQTRARLSTNTAEDNLNQAKPCSPRSP